MKIDKKLMNIHDYLVYSADLTPEDTGFYYDAVNHAPFSEDIRICQDWHTQGEDPGGCGGYGKGFDYHPCRMLY